jgi:multimeric flavodoxin WrbA
MKILSICGSPRKGNSETVLLALQKIFKEKGVENEIILLREKNIERCHGCVEFCNHQHVCRLHDDMDEIMAKMIKADAYVFNSPNYFQMPSGLFKDFIDRCCIFFTNNEEPFKNKQAAVICVGADKPEKIDVCTQIIANNFCKTLGLKVAGTRSFQTHSELNDNYDDVFTSGLNPTIKEDLISLAVALIKK